MKLIVSSILVLSSAVFAAEKNIKLDMKFSVGGQLISDPKLVLAPGSTGTVFQDKGSEKYYLEVTPFQQQSMSKDGRKVFAMNFHVGRIETDGSKTLLSSPKIISIENEKAQIIETDKTGHEILSVSVITSAVQ